MTTSGRGKGSPLVKVVVAAAALALVVLVALGLRWWTHPTLFAGLGGSFGTRPLPVADATWSTTVIHPQTEGESETVTIHGARAVFAKNTANATATFSICHMGPGEQPIGAVHDPATHCQDLVPLEPGASFRHGVAPDSDYLVVTITPTTPGIARLDRVEVEYRRGFDHLYQGGTESIRVDARVVAT